MRIRTKLAASLALAAVPLAACGGAPGSFEGSFLEEPFEARSALFGAVRVGENNPGLLGVRLLFTDGSDYCAYLGRQREARASGAPPPAPPPDASTQLSLFLGGPEAGQDALKAGTYQVRTAIDPYGLYPLEASGAVSTQGWLARAFTGNVQVEGAALQVGAETSGELTLQLLDAVSTSRQGVLKGRFTATYCEHL